MVEIGIFRQYVRHTEIGVALYDAGDDEQQRPQKAIEVPEELGQHHIAEIFGKAGAHNGKFGIFTAVLHKETAGTHFIGVYGHNFNRDAEQGPGDCRYSANGEDEADERVGEKNMQDLLVNFVGATVFAVIGFFYAKGKGKKPSPATDFIPSIKAEDRDFLRQARAEDDADQPNK